MAATALQLIRRCSGPFAAAVLCLSWLSGAQAAVLPEDRADLLFHSYSGDNVTIQGPSLLVRKEFAGKFSASANYYVDRSIPSVWTICTIAGS